MTRHKLILSLIAASLVLAATSAALNIKPSHWFASDNAVISQAGVTPAPTTDMTPPPVAPITGGATPIQWRPPGQGQGRNIPFRSQGSGFIISSDGLILTNASGDLSSRISMAVPGDTVRLKIWRERNARELTVKLGRADDSEITQTQKDSEAQPGQLGLALRPLTRDEQASIHIQGGLLVEGVAGAGARANLMPGDVLLAINGITLNSVDQINSVMAKKPKIVALLILRDVERIFVPVELG